MSAQRPARGDVLVLGATGTTGRHLLTQLAEAGHAARGASRSAGTRFDWDDPSTYAPAVRGARAVYLLPPVGEPDPEPVMRRFIEVAQEAGVRRFVLHSASVIDPGTPGLGRVHAHLAEQADEWAVLRPSWFMQNFAGSHYMAEDLRADGRLRTSTGTGRIAFVDAADIAAVAVRALTDPEPHQAAHVLTGPEALSYDDVAAVLSEVTGREVVHERIDEAAVARRMVASGIPAAFADVLAGMEALLRDGAEARVSDAVERVTGRAPRGFRAWARATFADPDRQGSARA